MKVELSNGRTVEWEAPPIYRTICRCADVARWLVAGETVGRLCRACRWPLCLECVELHPRGKGRRCAFCIERVRNRNGAPSGRRNRGSCDGEVESPVTTIARGSDNNGHSTRRRWRRHRTRSTAFVEVPADAGELLAELPSGVDRVYLVGGRPGDDKAGLRAWATAELGAGWSHAPAGHYLEGPNPTLRYRHDDGRQVVVLRAAAYLGEGDYTTADASAAWDATTAAIHAAFPGEPAMLDTPATMGRELLARSIPAGREWPTLPDELQAEIRHESGQGRVELLARGAGEIPALAVYDGRLMYAALCWGMAGGELHRDAGDDYLGQTRARYRADFSVPSDWESRCECKTPGHAGVGLLPVKCEDGPFWRWPHEPGETGSGWYDGAELHVALAHGWNVRIRERLWWDGYDGAGPLDGWAKRLVKARELVPVELGRAGELARNAIRATILHGLGALHGTAHVVTKAAPATEYASVPASARNVRLEGEYVLWGEPRPPSWPEMAHPEWSSAVWARARARLLSAPGQTGALHVPAGDVLGFRTDAIYLSRDPDWTDNGKAGRFRRVAYGRGPFPAPTDALGLLRLRDRIGRRPDAAAVPHPRSGPHAGSLNRQGPRG